jgi:hypothetical protein
MNFNLTFIPDEPYYQEAYNEIVSTLKYKKYEPFFATLMVIFGVGLYFYDTNRISGIFPIVFSLIGIYEFYKLFHEKNKWLKDRLDSIVAGQKIELEFSDSTIIHKGPFSNGELKWEGIKIIYKTQNGLIIKPENGISIYLPDRLFADRKHIEFILTKNKNSK